MAISATVFEHIMSMLLTVSVAALLAGMALSRP